MKIKHIIYILLGIITIFSDIYALTDTSLKNNFISEFTKFIATISSFGIILTLLFLITSWLVNNWDKKIIK